MTESPCKECDSWNTKVFPECRTNCDAVETYVTNFEPRPLLGTYIDLSSDMIYPLEEEEDNFIYF